MDDLRNQRLLVLADRHGWKWFVSIDKVPFNSWLPR